MDNYMKTIISGLKQWVSSQKSDWNQNDSSAVNFIKNRPFYSEEKEKALFSSDALSSQEFALSQPLIKGSTYTVVFNGVTYQCLAREYDGYIMIGNNAIYEYDGGIETDTGEPFAIEHEVNSTNAYLYTDDTITEAPSLSILGTVEEVHQIDSKYIPMPELADVAYSGNYYDLQNTPTIPWDTVRYATNQSLNNNNKQIARDNIGASSATNLLNGESYASLKSSGASESSGTYSVALGVGTTASGNHSYAEGYNTTASGDDSHAEGKNAIASGAVSHAEGSITTASGNHSHAEGYNTAASAYGSHAEGSGTAASAAYSHAEGLGTTASGTHSHAEGYAINSNIILTGDANAVIYQATGLNLDYVKIGFRIKLSADSTTAFVTAVDKANNTITLNKTLSATALASASAVVYLGGLSSGEGAHVEGEGTIAASKFQHAQGTYNIEDYNNKYAHIVGNGANHTARSNAHTLDWDGLGWFAGGLKVGGTSQDDAAAVEVALKTEATTTSAGLLSAADKQKLEGLGTAAYTASTAYDAAGAASAAESNAKSYTDTQMANYLPLAGGTISGDLYLGDGTNTSAYDFYIRRLVNEAQKSGRIYWGTEGILRLQAASDGTIFNYMDLKPDSTAFKQPVTIASGGTDAVTAEEALINLGGVNKAGDTMTGALNMDAKIIMKNNTSIQAKDTEGTAYSMMFMSTTNRLQIGYGMPDSYAVQINPMIRITSKSYGTTLPDAGLSGRLFFKKVNS